MTSMHRSLRGQLLVASPALADPSFDRSVVLVLEHTTEGALGVVLNRVTDEEVGHTLPTWRNAVSGVPLVFSGGPVEHDALIGLVWVSEGPDSEWLSVDGGLGTVDLAADPDDVSGRLERLRIFRGYSGWGPLQLEGELEENAWIVVDAARDDAFSERPNDLWRDVLRRQGGRVGWIGEFYPDDVSVN
jgi:putative transcriptional regulator